jgi:transcriptional regulator of nitric oxide reductase
MPKKKTAKKPLLRRTCGAMAAHMMLLERYPSFRAAQMRLEGATDRRRQTRFDAARTKLVTVKTVVNVVYKTAQQNISDAQIRSQIAVLNKDFRAKNPDRNQTPAPWKGLVSDVRIQFRLAKVTRTQTTKNSFTDDDGVKKSSTGGIAPFNADTHLNLWVCALGGSLLGYAQFPGGRRPQMAS